MSVAQPSKQFTMDGRLTDKKQPRKLPPRLEPLLQQSPSTNNSPTILTPTRKRARGRFRSVGVVCFDGESENGEDDDSTIASSASSRRHDVKGIIHNMDVVHLHRDNSGGALHKAKKHGPTLTPLARTMKMIDEYESELADHERHNRLPMARSDAHSISAATSLGSVADDLRRSYNREEQDFGSLALFIETRYLEMVNYEGAGDEPTRFKAAAAVDMMLKMCQHLGKYADLIKPILWELCNCIFVDFKPVEKKLTANPDNALKELVRTSTYFEHCAELVNRVETMQVEADMIAQGIHMKDVVKRYQTVRLAFKHTDFFIRDACFFLWKQYTMRKRKGRRTALRRALRYRFRRWRQYLANRTTIQEEKLSDELDSKIHRLMQLNDNILNSTGTEEESGSIPAQGFGEKTKSKRATSLVDTLMDDRQPTGTLAKQASKRLSAIPPLSNLHKMSSVLMAGEEKANNSDRKEPSAMPSAVAASNGSSGNATKRSGGEEMASARATATAKADVATTAAFVSAVEAKDAASRKNSGERALVIDHPIGEDDTDPLSGEVAHDTGFTGRPPPLTLLSNGHMAPAGNAGAAGMSMPPMRHQTSLLGMGMQAIEENRPTNFPGHMRIHPVLSTISSDDNPKRSGSISRQLSTDAAPTPLHRRQYRPVVADAATQTLKEDRLRTLKARRRQSMVLIHKDVHPSSLPGEIEPDTAQYDTVDDDDDDAAAVSDDDGDAHVAASTQSSATFKPFGAPDAEAATTTSNATESPSKETTSSVDDATAPVSRSSASETQTSDSGASGTSDTAHKPRRRHRQAPVKKGRAKGVTTSSGETRQVQVIVEDEVYEKDEFDIFEESDEEVEHEWTDAKVTLSPREHVPLTVETTCELIGYIYEQLFIEHKRHQAEHRRFLKHVEANPSDSITTMIRKGRRRFDSSLLAEPSVFHEKSILEVARKALLTRYHNKKISLNLFKDLLRSCLAYCKVHRRIEVFAKMCNLVSNATEDIYAIPYVPEQCVQFFFFILETLTEDRPEETLNILVSQRLERDLLLKKLPKIFPYLEKEESEYHIIVDKIIDMKIVIDDFRAASMVPSSAASTPNGNGSGSGNGAGGGFRGGGISAMWGSKGPPNRPMMVNFDDAIDLLLGYQELELQVMQDALNGGALQPVRQSKSTVIVTAAAPRGGSHVNTPTSSLR